MVSKQGRIIGDRQEVILLLLLDDILLKEGLINLNLGEGHSEGGVISKIYLEDTLHSLLDVFILGRGRGFEEGELVVQVRHLGG